jgi:hypothetical protein
MQREMYFDDFYLGQQFNSEQSYRVTAKEIISLAKNMTHSRFTSMRTLGKTLSSVVLQLLVG